MIFLRSDDHIIGVVVDEVKDVVGVASSRIQDPHPLFGGINLRYIRGVVEHGETLFVILDPELAFGDEIEADASVVSDAVPDPEAGLEEAEFEGLDFTFVAEALQTIGGFYPSGLNQVWLRSRFETWESERSGANSSAQITNSAEADSFLGPFFSSFDGDFWPDDYGSGVSDLLPEIDGANVRAWVIAVGNGHEAYSVACLLRSRFPEKVITVFAHDADLLNISSASTLTVDPKTAPGAIAQHLVEGSRGFVFSDEIRQSISFEYHDVLHDNTFPQVHLIVAKDYLSFLAEIPRKKLMDDIHEKISERGIVLVGANEVLPDGTYEPIASGPVRGFRKLQ